jgi:hypothetical protein
MSRVIFHAVSHPDMRLLAMYANAHNWYAAAEKFAPKRYQERLIPGSFRLFCQTRAHKGLFQVSLELLL